MMTSPRSSSPTRVPESGSKVYYERLDANTNAKVAATVVGRSPMGERFAHIKYEEAGKTVSHEGAPLTRITRPTDVPLAKSSSPLSLGSPWSQ